MSYRITQVHFKEEHIRDLKPVLTGSSLMCLTSFSYMSHWRPFNRCLSGTISDLPVYPPPSSMLYWVYQKHYHIHSNSGSCSNSCSPSPWLASWLTNIGDRRRNLWFLNQICMEPTSYCCKITVLHKISTFLLWLVWDSAFIWFYVDLLEVRVLYLS